MIETRTQSKLSVNRKNPSVRKYIANQRSLRCLPRKSKPVTQKLMLSNTVNTKGPRGLRSFGNTCYKNAIFQCLAEGASSLRGSPKQLVRKEGRNLQEQVLALLKLVNNTEGKVMYLVQARHAAKVELAQFADNTQ